MRSFRVLPLPARAIASCAAILVVTVALSGCAPVEPSSTTSTKSRATATSTPATAVAATPTATPVASPEVTASTPAVPQVEGLSFGGNKGYTDAEGYSWTVSYSVTMAAPVTDSSSDLPGHTTVALPLSDALLSLTNGTDGDHDLTMLGSNIWALYAQYPAMSLPCKSESSAIQTYGDGACIIRLASLPLPMAAPLPSLSTIGGSIDVSPQAMLATSFTNVPEKQLDQLEARLAKPSNVLLLLNNGEGTLRGGDPRLKTLCTVDRGGLGANAVVIDSQHPTSCL